MDSTLQRHLGRAEIPAFLGSLGDVVQREQVRRAAQVERQRTLREAAEPALEGAHVRVVDVAVGDPRERVTDDLAPHLIGVITHGGDLRAPSLQQRLDLADRRLLTGVDASEHLGDRTSDRCDPRRDERGRCAVGTREPRGRTMPDEHELCSVGHSVCRRGLLRPELAWIVSPEPFGVGPIHHREVQRLVEPAHPVANELGVDRQARRQRVPLRFGHFLQPIKIGPRPLRVDVIRGDRRDAAPIVDPCVEERPEVVGQVRWRLEVDLGRENQASGGERPQVVVARAGLRALHRRAQLGQKVLNDHFLHVSVPGVARGDRFEPGQLVGPGVADSDEDSRGERDTQLSRRFERGKTPLGGLVHRTAVRFEIGIDRLDHHPLARAERPYPSQLVARQRAGIGVRQQPGLTKHQFGHRCDVVDRGVVAPLAQPVPSHLVPIFGAFPQGEQRFVAPLSRTLASDLQHVVGIEEQLVDMSRRLSEGAVPAAVVAQEGERNEHLGAVRHSRPVGLVPPGGGKRHQVVERFPQQRMLISFAVGDVGGGLGHEVSPGVS